MKPLVFVASDKDREIAKKECFKIIDQLSKYEEVTLKAYILQHLITSFEDASGIDLKQGLLVEEKKNE